MIKKSKPSKVKKFLRNMQIKAKKQVFDEALSSSKKIIEEAEKDAEKKSPGEK